MTEMYRHFFKTVNICLRSRESKISSRIFLIREQVSKKLSSSGQSLLYSAHPRFQAPRSKSQSYLKDYRHRFADNTYEQVQEFNPPVRPPPGIPTATKR